ncbi:hypothetical protein OS493_016400 [Desmophyllum pertusum]|uniref:Adenosine deaminase domain-containing protein n=1 Tax=Desmophyllum pertusum TaxID=174260 RepID=A0A9W9ZQH1_9CNID|nr:hypothetical protein OS493_016400 [Desmophyllum pertusum]
MADSAGKKTTEERIPFNFFKKIPKIELHAHINGSISTETIEKLIKRKSNHVNHESLVSQWQTTIQKGDTRDLDECLNMFGIIYQLVDDTDTVFLVTKSVIEDFEQDNVRYLELRSTPRANTETGMTKQSYIEAVLAAIEEAKKTAPDIIVRFILAISRKHGPDDALDTVHLAMQYKEKANGIIVGIDLSGDPTAHNSRDFVPALKLAREHGLKLALHIAEVPDLEDTRVLLNLIPDRIGHGTCIHPENGGAEDLVNTVEEHSIPIELCLTSNVKTKTVPSYADHHMGYWYNKQHPCMVCTDDKGVFSTTLSEEYSVMARTFNLTEEQVWNLAFRSIDHIFEGEALKNNLRELWKTEKEKLMSAVNLK